MNWYTIIKFAFPVQEADELGDYLSVGHDQEGFKPIVIYLIDENLKLHTTTTDEHSGHDDWKVWRTMERIFANGRYDPNTHFCSFTIHDHSIASLSTSRQNYIKKTMEKILDKAFNNPTLILT